MSSAPEQRETETGDYEQLRKDLERLGECTAWSAWLTLGVTVLVSAALIVTFTASLVVDSWPRHGTFGFGLLGLILVSNSYSLYQQWRSKIFRRRFAEQIDIASKQRMRAEKFYGMSIIDPLTGMYNRRFGEERLKEEIARAERNQHELALIVLDLDYFKEINDQHGHAAGDAVLREFSRRLRRACRSCDIPVRIGGDEFLIVVPECSRENIHIILSRLVPFDVMVNKQKIHVGFSRGHAQYEMSDTPQSLVERADQRLYAEKQARHKPSSRDRDKIREPKETAAKETVPTEAAPAPATVAAMDDSTESDSE